MLETRNKILIETRYKGNSRIQVDEDQRRERRIPYDGRTITDGDWTSTRRWDVKSSSSAETQTETKLLNQSHTPGFDIEECGPAVAYFLALKLTNDKFWIIMW
jgi:hypothetical protein